MALGVVEGAGLQGLMGGTNESTIHIEGYEGKVVYALCGGQGGLI